MPSFTSLGVGSNLPLDTLLTNLTTAEKTFNSNYPAAEFEYGKINRLRYAEKRAGKIPDGKHHAK